MPADDDRLPKSLGSGGADEILADHFQHTGTGHSGHDGHRSRAEADGREQQVSQTALQGDPVRR
ncbi:hypothetical protein D3C76_1579250 [compost metagenome]